MYDIVLIQPPVSKKTVEEDPRILSYFKALQQVGSLLGDSPLEPNYGLLTLAAILRELHFNVAYLDLNIHDYRLRSSGLMMTDDILEETIKDYEARIFGISYMTVTYGMWGKRLSGLISKVWPDAKQIVGGIHPTMQNNKVLNECPHIDYVIEGEAENSIGSIVKYILEDKKPSKIPGVHSRFDLNINSYGIIDNYVLSETPNH